MTYLEGSIVQIMPVGLGDEWRVILKDRANRETVATVVAWAVVCTWENADTGEMETQVQPVYLDAMTKRMIVPAADAVGVKSFELRAF